MGITIEPITEDNEQVMLDHLLARGLKRNADVVDEAELARLAGLRGRTGWQAVAVRLDGDLRGYGAVVDKGERMTGDVAARTGEILAPLLDWGREQAGDRELTLWLRFTDETHREAIEDRGFEVRRRLSVLGREIGDVEVTSPPGDITIRPFRMDDLDGVLAVLLDAYEGTEDGDWTRDEITRRRSYPWYRDEDLLIAATEDNRIAGLHWTKRRSGGTGEVYNLAVAPWAQGQGLGRALMTAGMAHVRSWGGEDMILWVDNANEKAMQVYEPMGFTKRWDDLALSPVE